MTPSTVARLVATLFGVSYAAVLYVADVSVTGSAKQAAAYLPSAAAILVVVFDWWAWKWWPINLVFGRPRIDGTWLATLKPHPDSRIPEGGKREPFSAALIIEQSFFSLHVTQYTGESTSHSRASAFRREEDSRERTKLAYVYQSESSLGERPRNPPHWGACELEISGLTPTEISGKYWTDRLTAGDMRLTFFDRRADYSGLDAVERALSEREQKKA